MEKSHNILVPFNVVSGIPCGFSKDTNKNALRYIESSCVYETGRNIEVFKNSCELQCIIPIIVITKDDKYFVTGRFKESYNLSIQGFAKQCDNFSINRAAENILNNKLNIDSNKKLRQLGFVRDITLSKYLGIVFTLEVNMASSKHNNVLTSWMDFNELYKKYAKFNKFSKPIINYLFCKRGK